MAKKHISPAHLKVRREAMGKTSVVILWPDLNDTSTDEKTIFDNDTRYIKLYAVPFWCENLDHGQYFPFYRYTKRKHQFSVNF